MRDNLTYKLLDAKELFNYPNGEGQEWVDANRFDYKQADHTRCRPVDKARPVRVYDIVFYLDNRQCVGAPFTVGSKQFGYHPDIGEGLSLQEPTLKELSPKVSEIIKKLVSKDNSLLLNIDLNPEDQDQIPSNKIIGNIDYFWTPNRNPAYAHIGPAHQKAIIFPCSMKEVPAMVSRYWTRATNALPSNHFSGYVIPGNYRKAIDVMSGFIETVNTAKQNRQAESREFMEDNCLLAIDSNEYGWGIRLTTKRLGKDYLQKLIE